MLYLKDILRYFSLLSPLLFTSLSFGHPRNDPSAKGHPDNRFHERFEVNRQAYQNRLLKHYEELAEMLKSTPLILALGRSTIGIQTIKQLITESTVESLNKQDQEGKTLLMVASRTDRLEIVKDLLKKGVDMHLTNNEGKTALDLAKSSELRKALIDFYKENKNSRPHTERYLESQLEKITSLAKEHHLTDLQVAVLLYPEMIHDLISKKGKDTKEIVNERDKKGRTALFFAWDLEVAKTLVELGADVELRDKEGNIALHYAHTIKAREFLLNQGRNLLSVQNDKDQTVIGTFPQWIQVKLEMKEAGDSVVTLYQNPNKRFHERFEPYSAKGKMEARFNRLKKASLSGSDSSKGCAKSF